MLHPSYTELMEKINKEGEAGEEPNNKYIPKHIISKSY